MDLLIIKNQQRLKDEKRRGGGGQMFCQRLHFITGECSGHADSLKGAVVMRREATERVGKLVGVEAVASVKNADMMIERDAGNHLANG